MRERQRAREAVKVHTYANTFYFQFSAILFSTPFPFLEYFFYSRIIRSSIVFQVEKKKKKETQNLSFIIITLVPFEKESFNSPIELSRISSRQFSCEPSFKAALRCGGHGKSATLRQGSLYTGRAMPLTH